MFTSCRAAQVRGSQNIRRAVILAATLLACTALLLLCGYAGVNEISLSDQNEFESEPVSNIISV